ncbi:hypothetical protein [Streptomyces sp. B21-101]|uniref:hypothetical protein n=1 Tax=Streptomyces sp. B21-101 TaxID=3039415 RepID=UPI002FF39C2A
MFGRKASQAADSAAAAVARAGQKVAGDKGVKAANKITGPLFGQTFERCSTECGHCNVPCVNGTCNH